MPADDLPSNVQELLRVRVRDLEHLELLLFLRRVAPRWWTAHAVAAQLACRREWAARALERLCQAELLGVDESEMGQRRFMYAPATPSLDAAVRTIAQSNPEGRANVIRALNDGALGRLRMTALQTLRDVLLPWRPGDA